MYRGPARFSLYKNLATVCEASYQRFLRLFHAPIGTDPSYATLIRR